MKLCTILAVLFILAGSASGQDATVTANVAGADQATTLNLNGFGTAAVQVTGTWTATLTFEATVDGTNWFTINVFKVSDFSAVTTTAANGQWMTGVAGYRSVQVRASAYTSGTAVVTIRAAEQAQPIPVSVSTPAPPSNVTIDGQPIDVNVLSLPAGGGGLTDAELRATPVPVSATAMTSLDGKFPATAALADATANPTLTKIQTFQMAWNFDTATWNRQVQYADGDSAITKVGTLLMGENGGGIVRTVRVNDNGGLVVNQGVGSDPWPMFITNPDGSQAADVIAGQGLQVFSSLDDKFPAAAALADNTANPTLSKLQTFTMKWDSGAANWDRWDGSVTVTGTVDVTGSIVTIGPVGQGDWFGLTGGQPWGFFHTDTDLNRTYPDKALLADNTANPTLTKIQTFVMKWDSGGANWDRWDGSVTITGTVPVSAAALPLPAGASTSAAQTTGNNSLSSIDGKTPALVSGRVPVDPSGVTSPISAVNLDIHDLSFATDKVDTSGSIVGAVGFVADGAAVSGAPVRIAGKDGTGTTQDILTDPDGNLQTDVVTLPNLTIGSTLSLFGGTAVGTEPVFPLAGINGGGTWQPLIIIPSVPAAATAGAVVRQVGLPAAAAVADNTANPTLTQLQTFPMKWDSSGANWDKWDGAVSGAVNTLALNTAVAPASTVVPGAYEPIQITGGAVWVRESAPVQVVMQGYNPLLQRCNNVRRNNCRP